MGGLEPTSTGSASLIRMIHNGRLRAALVHLPVTASELYIRTVCSEKLMVCMRADDPLGAAKAIVGSLVS